MNNLNVKKGDTVVVITGKKGKEGIKGKQGKVISVDLAANKVIVDGLRIQKRHTKAKNAKSQAGIIEQSGPIDVSNVMVVCPKCGKPTRVGHAINENGEKIRVCKRKEGGVACGGSLDKGYKAEKKAKTEKKAEKTEKAEKVEKAEKTEKTEKTEKAEKTEGKAAKTKKAVRTEKTVEETATEKSPAMKTAAEKTESSEKADV
jgi:large subunit ribosomal protein L24